MNRLLVTIAALGWLCATARAADPLAEAQASASGILIASPQDLEAIAAQPAQNPRQYRQWFEEYQGAAASRLTQEYFGKWKLIGAIDDRGVPGIVSIAQKEFGHWTGYRLLTFNEREASAPGGLVTVEVSAFFEGSGGVDAPGTLAVDQASTGLRFPSNTGKLQNPEEPSHECRLAAKDELLCLTTGYVSVIDGAPLKEGARLVSVLSRYRRLSL